MQERRHDTTSVSTCIEHWAIVAGADDVCGSPRSVHQPWVVVMAGHGCGDVDVHIEGRPSDLTWWCHGAISIYLQTNWQV